MSQENTKASTTEEKGPIEAAVAGGGSNGTFFFVIGGLFVLVAAVVTMFIITSGDISETAAPAALSAEASAGKQLFISANCVACHPAEGRAGGVGPRLSTTGLGDATIKNIIRRGKGGMPGNNRLTDEEIDKMISYIRALKPGAK
jgi:mono/diheme cytochrome c family protein